jgi:hypothetical protein
LLLGVWAAGRLVRPLVPGDQPSSLDDLMSPQPESLTQLRTSPPTSAEGIEKYLSSGMIRGIGPVYAKKLVRSFGEKVFIKAAGRFDGNQLRRRAGA